MRFQSKRRQSNQTEKYRIAEEMYIKYSKRLISYIYWKIKDYDLAKDIVQEVFIKCLKKNDLGLVEPSAVFRYLQKACYYGLLNKLIEEKKEQIFLDQLARVSFQKEDAWFSEDFDVIHTIKKVISNFPENWRQAIIIHVIEGEPEAKGAAMIGITEDRFKDIRNLALRRLRKKLIQL